MRIVKAALVAAMFAAFVLSFTRTAASSLSYWVVPVAILCATALAVRRLFPDAR